MNYLTFGQEQSSYALAILVPEIRRDDIKRIYLDPYGINPEDVIVLTLHQTPGKNRTTVAEQKAYITEELVPVFQDLGIEYLLIGDGEYFKTFTGAMKIDRMLGYVLDSRFGSQKVAYVPNYRSVFHDPDGTKAKIALGIAALKAYVAGTYTDPGINIIEYAAYPETVDEIARTLQSLKSHPVLDCDIEAFSLKHFSAGIGTIGFSWKKGEGIAFPVDYVAEDWTDEKGVKYFGRQGFNPMVREMLRHFFETYKGKLNFHKIDYDVTVLIYQLFMEHILDNAGLLRGLEVMLRHWDCTRLISYLATNSCAGNKLSLKDQAQEYAGNYAQDEIKDIRRIPLPQLLQYNLVDCFSTRYVYEKNHPKMVEDDQLQVYETVFKPAMLDIIQMQLTGMPLDMARTQEVKVLLQQDYDGALSRMMANPLLEEFVYHLKEEHVRKRNLELKKKQITLDDPEVEKVAFNPNSGPQLQAFLFDHLGLPVLGLTKAKQPETGGDTLKDLLNHTDNEQIKDFLNALIDYKAVDKILTSFIPAMEGAQQGPDGHYYLFGNFNLGGTVSGRLSSSDPNLQNLPANSKYAKLIKSCFMAPPGWHFCGIDFASLEDRISALTTKDPQKLKVYTDGYDGHCLRAYAYFGDRMPDIDPNSVESINSIAKLYKQERQDSKVPTFALTYDGTYKAIMDQAGLPRDVAIKIEKQYHELYYVSDAWKAKKLDQASKDGYVTVAFGLRVRTPLLEQVIRGTRVTPHEAEAEGRTAGNALGQSWCLLNSRAGSEVMGKVRQSQFRHDIKPCAQIHDAQYYLVRDDIDAIVYANETVVTACQWQDHPDIAHDEVKLGGEFSIFYPTWEKECGIPNNATADEIYAAFSKHIEKLNQ